MKQKEFFELPGDFVARPQLGSSGNVQGWTLNNGVHSLMTARDSERIFKTLDTLVKIAEENGVSEIVVRV